MSLYPFDYKIGQKIKTALNEVVADKGFISHLTILEDIAPAADTDGIHAAITTTLAVSATCTVKAASAATDTLTITAPSALGASANVLKVSLVTAADDTLAVAKADTTIQIKLAKTTASKNTAELIQAAIRALETVGDIDVSEFTCTADGNWDTAAVATGETAAVQFEDGVTAGNIVTTDITNPTYPRNVTATVAATTTGDIGAIKVKVYGTNYLDEPIEEELGAFTANTAGTVVGDKAFKTITKIEVPAHDGASATTAIGFGDKLGLPYKLPHNTVLLACLDNAREATAPTVTASATAIESNTIDLNSTLNGKQIDIYLIV